MNRKKHTGKEVEETLNSLEGMQPASPGPFFYTRVMARLSKTERTSWDVFNSYISRPAIAFAVILLIVVINAVAVLQQTETSTTYADQTESAYDEFNLAANSFYDFENVEP